VRLNNEFGNVIVPVFDEGAAHSRLVPVPKRP
jgi:hypothetical protein